MGKRNTGRKLALKILYQVECGLKLDDVLANFLEPAPYMEETKKWAISLASEVTVYQKDLNELIKKYAIDWDLSRINPIDKVLLQMAFYEIIYLKTMPSIVINEAVEIAKKYSTEDSPKFINGILGHYIREIEAL